MHYHNTRALRDYRSDEKPYVAPFIRRLMSNATEDNILEANENVRDLVCALYEVYLARIEAGTLEELLANARAERIKRCDCELSTSVLQYLRAMPALSPTHWLCQTDRIILSGPYGL